MKDLLIFTQVIDERDDNLGFFVGWIRRLAEGGRRIHIACWKANAATVLPPNVYVYEMPKGKIQRTLALLQLSWRLRKDIQTVFVHMIASVVVACGWLWRFLGWRAVLWYTHGSVPWELKVAEKFVDKIMTATPESMRLATPKKVVTGHGIDGNTYHALPVPRESIALSVARITPRKNQMAFVHLCAKIRERHPDLNFHAFIVGDPRMEEDRAYDEMLRKEIVRMHLQEIVERKPSAIGTDLIRLYSQSAIFVSTSRTGSLDKVVLEALSCETPVLAVDEAFRAVPTVKMASEIWDDASVDYVTEKLRHPSASPEAREGIRQTAELGNLIRRIESILYA